MNALREIVKAHEGKIIITLDDDFQDDEYEVIVLPLKNGGKTLSRQGFLNKYRDQIELSDDFNAPLDDFKEYM